MTYNSKGEPVKLLRKVRHVEAIRGALSSPEWERLPVYTLTFVRPPSLNVRIDCGDAIKVVVPGYKPKSYSMSAERPGEFDTGEFDITFKVYPNGVCSGYLDSLKVGDAITVFRKGSHQRQPGSHVGIVAFGIGITEALPIAAAELAQPEAGQVRLLWASKAYGDLFWLEEIAALRAAHPERFSAETILSREQRDGSLHGRCRLDVLAAVFDGEWGTALGGPNEGRREGVRFLCVGTKPMMRGAESMLRQLGYETPGRHMLLS